MPKVEEDQKPKHISRIEIGEKIIIPIIGIFFSFVTAILAAFLVFIQNKEIASNQEKIQKELSRIQSFQFDKTLEQKYVEIFYTEIVTGDAKRQQFAIKLLVAIEPRIGEKLLKWANDSGVLKEEVQPAAKTVNAKIQLLVNQYLQDFEIGIYYKQSSPESSKYKRQAEEIKKRLIDIGILKSNLKIVNQWNGQISRYQIRFERESEADVADALQTVLAEIYPEEKFDKQTILGKTSGFISIFLGP